MKKTTVKTTTQRAAVWDGNGKRMHKQAQTEEERWRTAHGIDDRLRTKRRPKVKATRRPLERGEVRRREERRQQHVEREALRISLLKAVEPSIDSGSRLIKRSEMPAPAPPPTRSSEPPRSGYGVEPKGKRGKALRRMRRNGTLPP